MWFCKTTVFLQNALSFKPLSIYNLVYEARVSFVVVHTMKSPQSHSVRLLGALAAAFVLVLVDGSTAYAGFGITPPYLRNDKLTQGSTFTQEILLVRGDPVEDLKAEITLNVPGIENWITIDKGNEFLLPKGVQQVPIEITIRVPQDATFDRHQGSIRIRTLSPDPASGVSIALGAQIDVDLRVVDEIRDFEVKRVEISEAEEPKKVWWFEYPGKITFTMGIENTGNAPTAPSTVQLDIYDKRGNVVLESTHNSNTIDNVLPFETKEVKAYLPTRLPPGAYLVKYSIMRFEGEIKRSGELTLSILPRGTLTGYAGYGIEGLSTQDLLTIIIPGAVIALGLLGAAIILNVRRKNRARRRRRDRESGTSHDDGDQHTPARYAPPSREQQTGVIDLTRGRRPR